MTLLYTFDEDKTEAIMKVLAQNCQKRRLEKGLSRDALADLSKVPAATIAKFETKHVISLVSFVALAKALGYTNDLKQLLSIVTLKLYLLIMILLISYTLNH